MTSLSSPASAPRNTLQSESRSFKDVREHGSYFFFYFFFFFVIYFPLPGKSATHMLQPQTQSNPVLPWSWRLTQSFETLATTYKTIRLIAQNTLLQAVTVLKISNMLNKCSSSMNVPLSTHLHMVWHVLPVFSCRFQQIPERKCKMVDGNGPILNP